ncbi:hypothetical protein CUMW_210950 [Citrus unshiu]|uniref:Uncharacterized protein n=1 Tax=Citrus unshiu TaxID=55188 RepID=A0A2H5QAA0_CITUN|nr:hypothetical protein CUMW_210950 [Citrus unshiu]
MCEVISKRLIGLKFSYKRKLVLQDLHGRRVRVNYAADRNRGYGGGGFGGGGYGGGGYGGGGGGYGGGGYGGGGGGYGSNYGGNSGVYGGGANTGSGSNAGYDGAGDSMGGNFGGYGSGSPNFGVTGGSGSGNNAGYDGAADSIWVENLGGLMGSGEVKFGWLLVGGRSVLLIRWVGMMKIPAFGRPLRLTLEALMLRLGRKVLRSVLDGSLVSGLG